MNSQLHLPIDTVDLNKLRVEAERFEISVAELVRRKLASPPTDEEIIELRKIKDFFRNKSRLSNKKNDLR